MATDRYECLSDEYVWVDKGGYVDVRDGVAYNKDGDRLPVVVAALIKDADFRLVTKGATPEPPKVVSGPLYAVAAKLNQTFSTVEGAKAAAQDQLSGGEAYIVKIVGKLRVTKTVAFEPVAGD